MSTCTWRRELRDLGFSLLLVLAGEVVVQVSGWDRFWVLLAALVLGYTARAVIRSRGARADARAEGRREPSR